MVAALCRILHRRDVKVAPFKAQNMALNSAITVDSGERHLRYGGRVIGLCGGYQTLGRRLLDPAGIESGTGESDGGRTRLAFAESLARRRVERK